MMGDRDFLLVDDTDNLIYLIIIFPANGQICGTQHPDGEMVSSSAVVVLYFNSV